MDPTVKPKLTLNSSHCLFLGGQDAASAAWIIIVDDPTCVVRLGGDVN